MKIENSCPHPENAELPIDKSLAPDSNTMAESEEQEQKHREQSFSTEEGIQMEGSERHSENAPDAMHESLAPDSNAAWERRPFKHSSQRVITEEGTQTARNKHSTTPGERTS
jgi:hypothetical protein